MAGMDTTRPALQPVPRGILFAWLGFVVVLALMFIGSNPGSEWRDLVLIIGSMFVVFALVVLAITWAVARFFFTDKAARTAVVLLGPPALVGLVGILTWIL